MALIPRVLADLQAFIDWAYDLYVDLSDRLNALEEGAENTKFRSYSPLKLSFVESIVSTQSWLTGPGWKLYGSGLAEFGRTSLKGTTTVTGIIDFTNADVRGLDRGAFGNEFEELFVGTLSTPAEQVHMFWSTTSLSGGTPTVLVEAAAALTIGAGTVGAGYSPGSAAYLQMLSDGYCELGGTTTLILGGSSLNASIEIQADGDIVCNTGAGMGFYINGVNFA
jgi:hypothetical protein